MTRIRLILWLSLIVAFYLPSQSAMAQQMPLVNGRYFPLNQMTPPGTTAQWAAIAGKTTPEYFQPVRVSLPGGGIVTYYEGPAMPSYNLPAPAQASLVVGQMYRLRITNVPDLPGLDFFPTIELIDRLHPPVDKVEDFPIEIEFTLEELEWAANDRLVTKVIYLEQPNRVPAASLETKDRIVTVEPSHNALAEADLLGRPMAIVRVGGRRPDSNQPEPAFFGPGGPIRLMQKSLDPVSKTSQSQKRTSRQGAVGVVQLRPRDSRPVAQR